MAPPSARGYGLLLEYLCKVDYRKDIVPRILVSTLILVFWVLFSAPLRAGAELLRVGHVRVELVSSSESVQPGQPFYVALHVVQDKSWHTYWVNSTTGFPPRIEWTLPEGVSAGPILHAVPDVHEQGGIVDYVHEGEVLFPIRMEVSDALSLGQPVRLKADVSWLVCSDICVPGNAVLELSLPVSASEPVPSRWANAIGGVLAQVVPLRSAGVTVTAMNDGSGTIELRVHSGSLDTGSLYFMSFDGLISATRRQEQRRDSDGNLTLRLPLSKYAEAHPSAGQSDGLSLRGILVATNGWRQGGPKALELDVPVAVSGGVSNASADGALVNKRVMSVGMAALFAFLGGMLLNLMPCVFPVLGLKVMTFVNMAGGNRRKAWLHALVFTVGVLFTLLLLAVILLLLRGAGAQIGWGFQLQNPTVLFAGALVFLLFALNMNGVFEVGLSASSAGAGLQDRSGLAGAFFTGVLAVIVATPCSAPFLGSAIGFAMTGPALRLLAIFAAVGIGFASPYLILAAFPALLRFLPRPGRWMVILKHALSVLLYATVLYLLWAMIPFVGVGRGLVFVVAAFVLAAMAAVVYGRWFRPHRSFALRTAGVVVPLALLAAAFFIGRPGASEPEAGESAAVSDFPVPAFSTDGSGPHWTKWRPGLAESLAGQGYVVWVDFTARWCTTCQVNKALVFGSRRVRDAFRERGVIVLKADWTEQDPEITSALARWNRFAVPFNLLYLPGTDQPVEMPTILTPGVVLNALP